MIYAYLEITVRTDPRNRLFVADIYRQCKNDFLVSIKGARSKELLIRKEDVQVLHGFTSVKNAENYLNSDLFQYNVVKYLKPYMTDDPDIRIYLVMD